MRSIVAAISETVPMRSCSEAVFLISEKQLLADTYTKGIAQEGNRYKGIISASTMKGIPTRLYCGYIHKRNSSRVEQCYEKNNTYKFVQGTVPTLRPTVLQQELEPELHWELPKLFYRSSEAMWHPETGSQKMYIL